MSDLELRKKLREDLESPREKRRFGTGWISGVIGLVGGVASLGIVLCMLFPQALTMPELRGFYDRVPMRLVLYGLLLGSYVMCIVSLVLRETHIIGYAGLTAVLLATLALHLGGPTPGDLLGGAFLGLDLFLLSVAFTGLLFVPLERLRPQRDQSIFRIEWREDLFYYFVSSMLVQIFTFCSLWPSMYISTHTTWTALRAAVGSQPLALQFLEIFFLTDFVQYCVHRAFHRIPALWKFHAVHHSAKAMDWMAGARMHFLEILILRGLTVIPMRVLGFGDGPVYTYILAVYIYSTLIHANVSFVPAWLEAVLVTPRFHHWHHGIEKEAIDVNFAIHFPLFDRVFGTHHMPPGRWPEGYGIEGHPVPVGYWKQMKHPFV